MAKFVFNSTHNTLLIEKRIETISVQASDRKVFIPVIEVVYSCDYSMVDHFTDVYHLDIYDVLVEMNRVRAEPKVFLDSYKTGPRVVVILDFLTDNVKFLSSLIDSRYAHVFLALEPERKVRIFLLMEQNIQARQLRRFKEHFEHKKKLNIDFSPPKSYKKPERPRPPIQTYELTRCAFGPPGVPQ